MTKEEAEANDKDPTITKRQLIDSEESSPFDLYDDIDEFENDKDGYAIFPFQILHSLTNSNTALHFKLKQFVTYI